MNQTFEKELDGGELKVRYSEFRTLRPHTAYWKEKPQALKVHLTEVRADALRKYKEAQLGKSLHQWSLCCIQRGSQEHGQQPQVTEGGQGKGAGDGQCLSDELFIFFALYYYIRIIYSIQLKISEIKWFSKEIGNGYKSCEQ